MKYTKNKEKSNEIPRKKGGVIGRLRLGTFAVSSDSWHHITEMYIHYILFTYTAHTHTHTHTSRVDIPLGFNEIVHCVEA